jgi:hypothetical protein
MQLVAYSVIFSFACYFPRSAKAASEGSVLWATKKSVVARATRFAFGISVVVPADPFTAQLLGRPLVQRSDGSKVVRGGWSEIVPKVG